VDLEGADLTGANLELAILIHANLSHADLTGANLMGADLTEANLSHADLTGANLTVADLTDALLYFITGADYTDARLPQDQMPPWGFELDPVLGRLKRIGTSSGGATTN